MGKYHCTIDLLFDWFGLDCFANKNKNCQLPYSCFQTSQTGGQWYSDTSPFSIPWINSYSDCKPIGGFKHVSLTNFKKKIPKKDRLSIGLYHQPNLQEMVVTEATA